MATKTITIDLEAYHRLKDVQKENESFSQTIKRVIQPPFDLEAWMKRMSKIRLSEDAADAIEEHVAGRRKRSRRR